MGSTHESRLTSLTVGDLSSLRLRLVVLLTIALSAAFPGCRGEPPQASSRQLGSNGTQAAATSERTRSLEATRPRASGTEGLGQAGPLLSGPLRLAVRPRLAQFHSRQTPATVEDVWPLFDGDPTTGGASHAAGELTLALRSRARIESLAFLGELRGTLRVIDASGRELGAAAVGARRIDLHPASEGERLTLHWEPAQARAALPELVLLRSAPLHRRPARGSLVDRLANGLVTPDLRASATPSHASVAFATRTRNPRNGTFLLNLPVHPRTISRAFLSYSLRGRAHWSELRRAINGLPPQGPERVVRDPSLQASSRPQWEEISVESLREGENVLRFDPQNPDDPVGFEVHDVELLAWHDADALDLTSVSERASSLPEVLSDGNIESGISLRSGRYSVSLGARGQAHEVAVHLARRGNGVIEIRPRGASRASRRIDVGGLDVGWHRFELDSSIPDSDVLLVRTTARAEGDAIVSELHVASSPLPSELAASRLIAPAHGECRDGAVEIRGLAPTADVGSTVSVNGVEHAQAILPDHSFAVRIAAPPHAASHEWEAVIAVQKRDGTILRKSITMQPCLTRSAVAGPRGTLVEDRGAPFTRWVRASVGATFAFGEIKLQIPAGALTSDQQITIRPLAPNEVPSAAGGVTNVSPEGRGWRLGPHNEPFQGG